VEAASENSILLSKMQNIVSGVRKTAENFMPSFGEIRLTSEKIEEFETKFENEALRDLCVFAMIDLPASLTEIGGNNLVRLLYATKDSIAKAYMSEAILEKLKYKDISDENDPAEIISLDAFDPFGVFKIPWKWQEIIYFRDEKGGYIPMWNTFSECEGENYYSDRRGFAFDEEKYSIFKDDKRTCDSFFEKFTGAGFLTVFAEYWKNNLIDIFSPISKFGGLGNLDLVINNIDKFHGKPNGEEALPKSKEEKIGQKEEEKFFKSKKKEIEAEVDKKGSKISASMDREDADTRRFLG
jgi:hypothetical protein